MRKGLNHTAPVRRKRLRTTTEIVGFVKDWEIIADNLKKAGWSLGLRLSHRFSGQTIWIADVHRSDGKRFIVRADEKLTAFMELELAVRVPELHFQLFL